MDRWVVFERCRQRLLGIAFRMLGAVDDAEDLVQETSLRWLQADTATVRVPEGWLVSVITRLSIDRLRRAANERRAYAAIEVIEGVTSSEWHASDLTTERDSHVSLAFHALREHLKPVERTALVLREVFDYDYDEIARALGKSEAACRQIVRRARERVGQRGAALAGPPDVIPGLAERFAAALASGDQRTALATLDEQPSRVAPPARAA